MLGSGCKVVNQVGVIKAHMAAEPNCFKVRGGMHAAGEC